MLGRVTVETEDGAAVLRLTTRAQARIESHFDRPFQVVMRELLGDPDQVRVTDMAALIAAVLDDGRGVDTDAAFDAIDAMGGIYVALGKFTAAVEAGIPEELRRQAEDAEAPPGNAARPKSRAKKAATAG